MVTGWQIPNFIRKEAIDQISKSIANSMEGNNNESFEKVLSESLQLI